MKLKKVTCLCMSFLIAAQILAVPQKASAEETIYAEYTSQLNYGYDNPSSISSYGNIGEDEQYSGIRSFEVLNDGRIMVMDAQAKQILLYNDEEQESIIDLSFCTDPQYFVFQDNMVIVFDLTSAGRLYFVDLYGNIIKETMMPKSIDSSKIVGFYPFKGENYLLTLDKELISLDNLQGVGNVFETSMTDKKFFVSYEDLTWSFDKSNRDFLNPLYVDDMGYLYIEKSTIAKNTEYIQGETYLLKIDRFGNEVASMRLKLEDYVAFPKQFYDFCADSLYVLQLFDGVCNVSKVTLGTERETSRIAQMEQQGADTKQITEDLSRASRAISVSKTRDEVKSIASDIISSSWTVTSGNKEVVSGAALPKCVKDASVGDTITGIPYCWGGYGTLSSIVKKLSNGSMAGNVEKKVVTGPVGYDCSGYVSYCYGLGEHVGTSNLSTSVSVTKIDYDDMQSMDMILKSGHVMLFKSFSGNYVTVYEATSEGEQKTREHSYTINHIFVTKGYKAYTPW